MSETQTPLCEKCSTAMAPPRRILAARWESLAVGKDVTFSSDLSIAELGCSWATGGSASAETLAAESAIHP
jgi:hypothetical protein